MLTALLIKDIMTGPLSMEAWQPYLGLRFTSVLLANADSFFHSPRSFIVFSYERESYQRELVEFSYLSCRAILFFVFFYCFYLFLEIYLLLSLFSI